MTDQARAIEAGARADLLPCPFCGAEARFSFGGDGEVVNVRCSNWEPGNCLGAGPNTYSETTAAAAWNTRAIASGALVPASADNTTLATSATNRIAKIVGMSPEIRDDVHGIIQEALAGLAPASAVEEMRERCAKKCEELGDAIIAEAEKAHEEEDYDRYERLECAATEYSRAAHEVRQLDTALASGDYVVVHRNDLTRVVDIAGRNEAAPEIGRVRAMLHAASKGGGK